MTTHQHYREQDYHDALAVHVPLVSQEIADATPAAVIAAAKAHVYRPASRLEELRADTVQAIDVARQQRADAEDGLSAALAHAELLPPGGLSLRQGAAHSRIAAAAREMETAYRAAKPQVMADSTGALMLADLCRALVEAHDLHAERARGSAKLAGDLRADPDDDAALCNDAGHLVNAPRDAWCQPNGACRHQAQWTDTRDGRPRCTVLAAHEIRVETAHAEALARCRHCGARGHRADDPPLIEHSSAATR